MADEERGMKSEEEAAQRGRSPQTPSHAHVQAPRRLGLTGKEPNARLPHCVHTVQRLIPTDAHVQHRGSID